MCLYVNNTQPNTGRFPDVVAGHGYGPPTRELELPRKEASGTSNLAVYCTAQQFAARHVICERLMQGKRCMARVAGGSLLAKTEAEQNNIVSLQEMVMAMVSMALMVDGSID